MKLFPLILLLTLTDCYYCVLPNNPQILVINIEDTNINETALVSYQNYECEFSRTDKAYIKISATHSNFKLGISINLRNDSPKTETESNVFTKISEDSSLIYIPITHFDVSNSTSTKTFYMGIECFNNGSSCSYSVDFSFEEMIELEKFTSYSFNTSNNYLTNDIKIIRKKDSTDKFSLLVSRETNYTLWITLEIVYPKKTWTLIETDTSILNYTKVAYIDESLYPYVEGEYYHLIINAVNPNVNVTILTEKYQKENIIYLDDFKTTIDKYIKNDNDTNGEIYFEYKNQNKKYNYIVSIEYSSKNFNIYLVKNQEQKLLRAVRNDNELIDIKSGDLSYYNKFYIKAMDDKDLVFSLKMYDSHSAGKNVVAITVTVLVVFLIFVIIFVIYLRRNKKKGEDSLPINIEPLAASKEEKKE